MDDNIKYLLPGWKIVRMIGKGSFGIVYEVEKDDGYGRVAHSAIKVISIPESAEALEQYRDDGYDDLSLTELFRSQLEDITSEFALMSKLKGNSNIVSYEDHAIIQHESDPGYDIYIRMELLTSLPKYLERHEEIRSDECAVIKVGLDICNALERCMRHNILHRDIKPQNIFVNEEGDFKLGDFGIAKTTDHTTKATKAGTYGYMAPEVYWGKPYNANVDIYSLGMVMYWMLNERRGPFVPLPPTVPKPSQNSDALDLRMHGEPLPAPKNGSDKLKQIILKACAFDPTNRYSSPSEMRRDLESLTTNQNNSETASDLFSSESHTYSHVGEKHSDVICSVQENLPKDFDKTICEAGVQTEEEIPVNNEHTVRMLSVKDDLHFKCDEEATVHLFSKKRDAKKTASAKDKIRTISSNSSNHEGKTEKQVLNRKVADTNRKKKFLLIALAAIFVIAIIGILIAALVGKNKSAEQLTAQPTSLPTEILSLIPSEVPTATVAETFEPTSEPTLTPEPTPEPTSTPEPTPNPTAEQTASPLYTDLYDEDLKNVIVAKSDLDLVINDPVSGVRIIRNQETNLGDLCADAYRAMGEADIAFVNGGGIRDNIPAGDITFGQIVKVYPFNNALCVVEATGQEVLDALELSVASLPAEYSGFLQVSGLKLTIDLNVDSTVERDERNMFARVAGDRRVKDVQVLQADGTYAPIDYKKIYTVASDDYLLKDAANGYNMFQDNTVLRDCVMLDNQVLINYIVDILGGTVGGDYVDPYGQGRITIIEKRN